MSNLKLRRLLATLLFSSLPAILHAAPGTLPADTTPPPVTQEKAVAKDKAAIRAFAEQLKAAIQANDDKKLFQLLRDNPEMAKAILPPELLAELGQLGQSRPELDRLQEEGEEAYNHSNYPQALKKWQAGLDQARQLADKRYISQFMTNLGVVYRNLGQYPKALEYYQQALAIDKELGDKRGEGSDLTNLGVVYDDLGQYPKALEYYQQALAINKELGDKRGEGSDLTNLGVVYRNLGQYPKALEYYQQALAIKRELGDKRGIGNNLTNLGVVYSNLGQYPKALEYYQQALAIKRELGDKRGIGNNLTNLGVVYSNLGQYPKALEYYQQALAIDKELGDKRGEGSDLGNLGVVYSNLGQYDLARTHFQGSLAIHESLGSLDSLWIAQRGLASTEVLLKQPQNAIQHYEQALDTLEQLRTSLTADMTKHTGIQTRDLKTSFMRNKFYVYDELINLYHDQGNHSKAFETFERKQGRGFVEEMAQSGVRRYVGLPPATSQEEATLETQVEAARKIWGEAAGQGDEAVKPARDQLATAKTALEVFKAKLKVNYPRYYDLKYPQPIQLPDLQKQVLHPGEAVLIYNVRKEATDVWIISPSQFTMVTLPWSATQLEQQVASFREIGIDAILKEMERIRKKRDKSDWPTEMKQAVNRNLPGFLTNSYALYQQLFPNEIQQRLAEIKPTTLYIVPTRALYELPFEALVTTKDQEQYLLHRYAISYLSSASLLKTLRDPQPSDTASPRQPLLAFANPVYSSTACQQQAQEETGAGLRTRAYLQLRGGECFTELPETGEEAARIADVLPINWKYQPAPLQRQEQASKQTVLKLNDQGSLDDFQYILFATHGVLPNEVTGLVQPALVLSHPEQDGYLTMGEVFGLKFNADLITLSACNTGRGQLTNGEGVMGLTRAFMYAGTPAVAMTLWTINSDASKELTTRWFTRLKDHPLTLPDALRQTKLELVNKAPSLPQYYRHPYFWSGWVVFGVGREEKRK